MKHVWILSWLWLVSCGASVFAQPPQLQAGGKIQRLDHDGQDAPQVFDQERWTIIAPTQQRGVTVQWSCEPFRLVNDPNTAVDAHLSIEITKSNRGVLWVESIPQSRTDFRMGQLEALVMVESNDSGVAQAGLTVTFLGDEVPLLVAGEYETTVIGTITEN